MGVLVFQSMLKASRGRSILNAPCWNRFSLKCEANSCRTRTDFWISSNVCRPLISGQFAASRPSITPYSISITTLLSEFYEGNQSWQIPERGHNLISHKIEWWNDQTTLRESLHCRWLPIRRWMLNDLLQDSKNKRAHTKQKEALE